VPPRQGDRATAPAQAPPPTVQPAAAPAPVPPQPTLRARSESLFTKNAEYIFSNDAGGIERVVLLLHEGDGETALALNRDRAMPIGAMGTEPGVIKGGFEMQVDPAVGAATFQRTDPDGLQITKRFDLPSADDQLYVVRMTLTFANTGSSAVERSGYFVSTGGAAPIHVTDLPMYTRFDWVSGGNFGNIDVNWFSPGGIPWLGIQWSGLKELFFEKKENVEWAAVASQYFCTIITPEKTRGVSLWAKRFDMKKVSGADGFGIQGGLGMPSLALAPGQSLTETFVIYAGPKELSRLRSLGEKQSEVMSFGMFGFISELLLWAMNSLYAVLHSYAAAIIVLTIIIKLMLWPVQNKATNEMRKMALLSPKMTELREKYKDDPQKMNEEVMKLYREYGVNPFSGCLPMLIQIPIFFGFYAMLGTAIELRDSSFLWVDDLSQPDTVFRVLGFPINVLPLVMAGTMVWQMAITPKSGDAVQQRILYFMPIVFIVFCYNYASALSLYWTTQNIFSIVQLYLTRNKPLPTLEKKSVVAKRELAATKKAKKKRPVP
jgi:YidC/Oxa1 family membrane protein insertase